MICKLSELNVGDKAEIINIEAHGEILRRLLDMGLIVGKILRLRKIAPLGDPIYVVLRGLHVTLRKKEASFIFVNKLEGEHCGKRHCNRFGRKS